jgi:hypothetical protein
MPTLSWILETAEERFYERGGEEATSSSVDVACPICGRPFNTVEEVSWHVNEAHPLERPILMMDGAAAPSRLVCSTPFGQDAIAFTNTTTIRASCNGRVLDPSGPEEVAMRLSSEPRAIFQIELENARAEDAANVAASYTVSTAIPDEADLTAVERLFLQHLVVEQPSPADVRTFADAAAPYSSADRYTDGLAQYVYAILAKEGGHGTSLPFDAFQVKIQQALSELSPHEARPIPQAVCAAARLNINDVRRSHPPSGNRSLDGLLTLLHGIAAGEMRVELPPDTAGEALAPICPIDRDTHLVLRAFDDLYRRQLNPDDAVLAEYAARAADATLSAFDRTKLHVMLAFRQLTDGAPETAERHLDELVHDAIFGRWATLRLDAAEVE